MNLGQPGEDRRPKCIMGVNFDLAPRMREVEATILVLARRDERIEVLSSDTYRGTYAQCIREVVYGVQSCPEPIDELMAGNDETFRVLEQGLLRHFSIRLNFPKRRYQDGGHIVASIDRLWGRA